MDIKNAMFTCITISYVRMYIQTHTHIYIVIIKYMYILYCILCTYDMYKCILTKLYVLFRLGLITKMNVLNPKACSVIELYGILDPVTRDWTDGLLSNIFREINKPTDKNEKRYILFDGDVDALWVENMNSVMDDNKLLTLANGERIRLQKHCALLVEVRKRMHMHTYISVGENSFFKTPRCNVRPKNVQTLWNSGMILF